MSIEYHDLKSNLDDAEKKAWDSLARYKFWMFGYHAASWVNTNRLTKKHFSVSHGNPFKELIDIARKKSGGPNRVFFIPK